MSDLTGFTWLGIYLLIIILILITTSEGAEDLRPVAKRAWAWIIFGVIFIIAIIGLTSALADGEKTGQTNALKGIQDYKMIITEKQYKTDGKYLYKTEYDTTFVNKQIK